MIPAPGDVLISNPTATVEHCVSIVPDAEPLLCANHDGAVARAHEIGRDRHVDVWLTEDHTHFLKLGSYRSADAEAVPAGRKAHEQGV
jgi:hypothetical protein